MGVDLGVEARGVKALVALHVGKQARVESAAAGAGDAGSCGRVQGWVFLAERGIGKGEIEVGLYPRAKVLRGEQVRLLVLPILAPALLVGVGLGVLRETGKQVGVGCGDALGAERLGDRRDKLQQGQTGVDVGCALAGLLDQRATS